MLCSKCTPHLLLFSFRKKDDKDEGRVRKPKEPKRKTRETDKPQDEDGEWETIQRKQTRVLNKEEMKKMLFGKEVDEVDHAVIKEKRDEIMTTRGKKSLDRGSNIENLKLLLQFSQEANLGVGIEVMLLVDIITVIYEIPSGVACMKDDIWERYGHP